MPSRLPSMRPVLRRRFRAALRPTPFQVSPVKVPREQPWESRPSRWAGEVNLRSSSCRSLRAGELRLGQSGRWLPPSLDISPGYTCGIGITAGLLAVHIRHRLRQAIL